MSDIKDLFHATMVARFDYELASVQYECALAIAQRSHATLVEKETAFDDALLRLKNAGGSIPE